MTVSEKPERVGSIDFFRGVTMILLVGEFTGLYTLLHDPALEGTFLHVIGEQLHHHSWNGLRFWDLIQPFFMFLVGVSLPFAVSTREKRGFSSQDIFKHVLKRSALLLFMGWALYCIGPGKITFHFQNVLSQIAFTYLLAYLIIGRSTSFQIVFSIGLLLVSELIYRLFPVDGFNQAYTAGHNFGEWIEYQIDGKLPGGHWVSFNAIPTAAHTIWGVLAGRVMMNENKIKVVKTLTLIGIVLLAFGYAFDGVTPIVKRIATSSFVVVSGGWCLLVMAISYWFIDVRGYTRYLGIFTVVSANSLFIYLFAHLEGSFFLEKIVHPFSYLIFDGFGEFTASIITALIVWYLLWLLCNWMFKNKIFIKI